MGTSAYDWRLRRAESLDESALAWFVLLLAEGATDGIGDAAKHHDAANVFVGRFAELHAAALSSVPTQRADG